ncbi:MAG: DUF5131 family protein [Nitrospiraceae bacterium]|nr:DUF5131 family protein [Nitrospiraceae bacterium]
MNKTSIEWCDYSWNPITGCLHSCRDIYCYNTMKGTAPLNRFGAVYIENGRRKSAKDWRIRETGELHIAEKGEINPFGYDPTFYSHRLDEPLKVRKPGRIFVVDAGDAFGQWVPAEWIRKILDVTARAPWHTFQFLTKNPRRYLEFEFPGNCWIGTNVTLDRDRGRAELLLKAHAPVRFLSVEPLMGEVTFDLAGFQWIIIGAQTGRSPVRPEKDWIERILITAERRYVPVCQA